MINVNNGVKLPDRIWFGDFMHLLRCTKFNKIGEDGSPLLSSDSEISVSIFKKDGQKDGQVYYGELIVPVGEYIEFVRHYELF